MSAARIMDLAKYRWLILGLAFALGLMLLGRWAIRQNDQNHAARVPAGVEGLALTHEQRAPAPSKSAGEPAPQTAFLAQQPTIGGGTPRLAIGLSGLELRLDEGGAGSLPSAFAGSTLSIRAHGFEPITISEWNAQPLELKFKRR